MSQYVSGKSTVARQRQLVETLVLWRAVFAISHIKSAWSVAGSPGLTWGKMTSLFHTRPPDRLLVEVEVLLEALP